MSAPDETPSRLARALIIEGQAQTLDEMNGLLSDAGLFEWALDNGLYGLMAQVIDLYKPAAAREHNSEGFRGFGVVCQVIAQEVANHPLIAALATHNAATGYGRAGQLGEQKRLNEKALATLEGITTTASRDADWEIVRSKVMAGLYENGHHAWNESFYHLEVLEPMSRLRFKDEAGRRHFLAQKLRSEGRLEDAREVLLPVRQDSWSAANQRERAIVVLDALELELGVHSPI